MAKKTTTGSKKVTTKKASDAGKTTASKSAGATTKKTSKKTTKKTTKKVTRVASASSVKSKTSRTEAATGKAGVSKASSAKLSGEKTPTNKPTTASQVKSAKAAASENRFKVGFSAGKDNQDREPLTEDQLRKVKTGLTKKDLAAFTRLLLEKRAELSGDVESLRNDVKNSGANISYEHMADIGSDNYEQEFTLGLVETERQLLNEIDDALHRIEKGYYGVCIETGQPINRARLEAKPWARYCIEVAREKERHAAPRFRA